MSKCISARGEFSDHDALDESFCCVSCGAFDEGAVVAFHAAPVARVEALASRWENATDLSTGEPSIVMQALAAEVRQALAGKP